MAARKTPRYKGELFTPIRPKIMRSPGFAVPDPKTDPDARAKIDDANRQMQSLYENAIAAEFERKLHLLMKHYSIEDPQDWQALALELARDHVPGFRLDLAVGFKNGRTWGPVVRRSIEKTGRPDVWTGERLDELLEALEKAKKHLGQNSDLEALKRIARRPWAPPKYWGPPPNHRGDQSQWIRTLQSRLAEAKSTRREADKLWKLLEEIRDRNSGNTKPSC